MKIIDNLFGFLVVLAAICGFIFMFRPREGSDKFEYYMFYYNQNFQGQIVKHFKDEANRGSYTIWLADRKFRIPENIFINTKVGDSIVKNASRYYIIYRNGLFYDSLDLNEYKSAKEFRNSHFSTPFTNE